MYLPGESCSDSDDEEIEGDDLLDYQDGWLIEDDDVKTVSKII